VQDATVTISGLTITDDGYGVANTSGTLTVNNCNIAAQVNAAIYSQGGPLTVSNCTLTNGIFCFVYEPLAVSNCTINGGSIYDSSSAIGPGQAATVSNCTVNGGGGISNPDQGTMTISSCNITNNTSSGVVNGGTMVISNSTIANNSITGAGGGILNEGTLTITNSTVAFNMAKSSTQLVPLSHISYNPGIGGGIYNTGTLTLNSCTIADNTAQGGNGGGILNSSGTVTVHNTLIAQNILEPDKLASPPGAGPDVYGSFTSQGYNLIGDGTGSTGFTAPGDQVGTSTAPIDPLLGPLQNNGGPTATMALLAGSPAIDAGDPTGAPATDQRGFARLPNLNIDIGAFEMSSTLLVTNLGDSGVGSLRQAILDANSLTGDLTIAFAAGLTGSINLASPLPDLTGNIDLEGPGAANLTVVPGGGTHFQLFHVAAGATDTIAGLSLTGGSASEGGAILNDGTLTVSNCTVYYNGASEGGGIYNNGTLTVSNCTVSGSSATEGGGIYNDGTMTLSGSTIAGNGATGYLVPPTYFFFHGSAYGGSGGGIYNDGTMTIVNSTIASNSVVGGDGAGITTAGTLTISSSTVAQNVAQPMTPPLGYLPAGTFLGTGGGISNHAAAANVVVHNTIIAQNLATDGSPDVAGSFTSQGYNLIGDGTGSTGFTAPGDQVGTSTAAIAPLLGPLQNNGGPTATMALQEPFPFAPKGSPAIDAGDSTGAPTTDQRGFVRLPDPSIDIGAFEVDSANQLYVAHLYQEVLGRMPDAAGFQGWVSALDAGTVSSAQLATIFWDSTEHRVLEIEQCYQTYLHRQGSSQECSSWANWWVAAGLTEVAVIELFVTSPEYTAAHASNQAYVTGLYNDVLNRNGVFTTVEVAGWQGLLDEGVSRAAVASDFLNSEEGLTQGIDWHYTTLLHRLESTAEQQAWLQCIADGGSQVDWSTIAPLFLSSEEFLQQAGG